MSDARTAARSPLEQDGRPRGRTAARLAVAISICASLLVGCSGEGSGPVQRVHVPSGASFSQVTDSLAAHGVIESPTLFRLWARATGADQRVQAGTYGFRRGAGWRTVLDDLQNGRVMTAQLVIPEGWNLRAISARLAGQLEVSADSVLDVLRDSATVARYELPGPTLEGYLYPATYVVPVDASLELVTERMVRQYRTVWTPRRRSRADSLDLTEREVVTLASIIEAESVLQEEMPIIAAVFHNRLRIGYPLQADPTVQYALGQHQSRLLYAHIDSVADDPYNTYTHRGLPPGPIASPSVYAIDAALWPADVDYLYFVARPDGSHVFTRSLQEHNRARARIRQQQQGSPALER